MTLIQHIKSPILSEMQSFNSRFKTELITENEILTNVCEYLLQSTGKQLRPMLTLLSAKLCGEINPSTLDGAIALELLHTASLIHDDVVDDAYERRGNPSVKAHWNNKVAILSGDYLFSKSLKCVLKTKNLEIMNIISNIVIHLCEGELMQLANQQQTIITEAAYFEIIRKKTAILFSSCTEIGGLSARASKSQLEHLRNFGDYVGICFQIKDDLFDYTESVLIGKPTGNDLREGKFTLPLIFALDSAQDATKEMVVRMIQSKDFSEENIVFVSQFVHEHGGIAYAEKQMEMYKNKALEELKDFKDSEVKVSLIACAEYATSRDH